MSKVKYKINTNIKHVLKKKKQHDIVLSFKFIQSWEWREFLYYIWLEIKKKKKKQSIETFLFKYD